jgi:hypothetical protein
LYQTRFGFQPSGGRRAPEGGPYTYETTLDDKGTHTLFLSPGIQFFLTKDLKAEFGIQLPIIRPEDGWMGGRGCIPCWINKIFLLSLLMMKPLFFLAEDICEYRQC